MFEFLYPVSFFVSLSGLIFWFYFKDKELLGSLMQKIFFGGMLVYFVSLLFSPGMFSVKLFALFRDLLTMGLIAQFFNFFRKSKITFFVMLAVLFGAFQFKGKPYMQSTFAAVPIDNGMASEGTNPATDGIQNAGSTTQVSADELDIEGELLIEVKASETIQAIQAILSKYDLTHKRAFHPAKGNETDLDDCFKIDVPQDKIAQLEEIVKTLRASNAIDWVEYNEVFKINPIESKMSPPAKIGYGINDPDVNKLWGFKVMEMDKLYRLLEAKKVIPQKKAKVFIVDSGIDAKHEDLKDRYHSVNTEYDKDTNGHGTHCAGIAASVTNNGKGVASVFPSNDFAELTGVKVMNFMGLITQQRLIEGIIEAIDNGADVISVSIGGPSREAAQEAFQEVVEYADKANAIIVVAAGNSNLNATGFTPANADGVITVSAIDPMVNKAVFSNMVGDLKMGIAAPGVDVYSTFPGSTYKPLSGTSMACPYVSGLVGLLKSINPELTTAEVYGILKSTGKKTGSTSDTGMLIQPAAAVKRVLEVMQ